jgi:hypothetical protein
MFTLNRLAVLGVFVLAATQLAVAGPDVVTSQQTDAKAQATAAALYAKMPLAFELNEGQTDPRVKAFSRGSGYGLFLTADESVVVLTRNSGKSAAIRMKLLGAGAARVVPADPLPGTVNSFIGNDRSKWRTNIPTFSKVKYESIYSGVDLIYYGNQQQLEYDFVVAPGADPNAIRFNVSGAKVRIDSTGDLVMRTSLGEVRHHKPVIYQEIAGVRHAVAGRFVKRSNQEIAFAIADYDRRHSLVIDPTFNFSTYLGGSGADVALCVAVDALGDTFIGGSTTSTNFPTDGAYAGPYPTFPGPAGSTDAFFSVIFFQGNGSKLFISSYYGGANGNETVNSIALLQGSGQLVPYVYVAGTTTSTDLPTVNPLQGSNLGVSNAFVAQLKFPSDIAYSSYLGGSGKDSATAITTDSLGNIAVAGTTTSTDFPTLNAVQSVNEGGTDGFVTKFNSTFTGMMYSTYLGGSGTDIINSIADAKSDWLIIVGSTTSTAFGIPESTGPANSKAFVTSLSSTGEPPTSTTGMITRIFGGQGVSSANGVAAFDGNATCTPVAYSAIWVTGYTTSGGNNPGQPSGFPITANAIQSTSAGEADAWVQVYAAGKLKFSSYYGGSGNDVAKAVGVDSCGNAFIAGTTNSTNFPVTSALQSSNAGGYDGFIVNFQPGANFQTGGSYVPTVFFSTYLGGSGTDIITSIAVSGKAGNPTVTGYTNSTNFPIAPGAGACGGASPQPACVFQETYGGGTWDAFVTKITTQ